MSERDWSKEHDWSKASDEEMETMAKELMGDYSHRDPYCRPNIKPELHLAELARRYLALRESEKDLIDAYGDKEREAHERGEEIKRLRAVLDGINRDCSRIDSFALRRAVEKRIGTLNDTTGCVECARLSDEIHRQRSIIQSHEAAMQEAIKYLKRDWVRRDYAYEQKVDDGIMARKLCAALEKVREER